MTLHDRYNELGEQLYAVQTLADLRKFSLAVTDSGLCDESGQIPYIGAYGVIAPWSTPPEPESEILSDKGERVTVRLPSGETAEWTPYFNEWLAVVLL
jgi:hypothetical protein